MKTENVGIKFELTNGCTCLYWNDETDEWYEPEDCYGDCWEMSVEDFTQITKHLFEKNDSGFWKIKDIALWNRDVSGIAKADTVTQLIEAMTVRSEWIMRGEVFDDHIEYSLSHHDAMGSNSSVWIVSEEEAEANDWYRY